MNRSDSYLRGYATGLAIRRLIEGLLRQRDGGSDPSGRPRPPVIIPAETPQPDTPVVH